MIYYKTMAVQRVEYTRINRLAFKVSSAVADLRFAGPDALTAVGAPQTLTVGQQTSCRVFKGMAKSHVFVLMQISYTYIVFNNFPKFQENRDGGFWDMCQSMCIIRHYWGMGIPNQWGGGANTRSLSVQKNEKITRTVPILK